MSKRRRCVAEEVEAASETTRQIKALRYSQLSDDGAITRLPYPALDHVKAGKRPGKIVDFVGRRKMYPAALKRVLNPRLEYQGKVLVEYEGVVITGPSGSGKSCFIRAIACQLIATLPEPIKVVCFWYLNASKSLLHQFQDALLFTYCDECVADPGLAERILKIKSVETLKDFLEDMTDCGDVFYVVSDGEEQLDVKKSDGSERGNEAVLRAEARLWLDTMYRYATFEVKALSPKAEEASPRRNSRLFRWEVEELYRKVEVQTLLADTPLGRMLANREKRWSDVEFFAGAHPLSLWRLLCCCVEFILAQEDQELVEKGDDWVHLFDKGNWSSILASFRCGEPFQEIRESTASMADRTFQLGKGFCSDYIRAVYMEAEAKTLEARKFRCRELTDYVHMLLRRGVVFYNWSALGWACESFVGDAILKVGLNISGLEHIAPKEVVIIHGGQPIEVNATKLEPGECAYWTPARYSFKYIDGIILYKDKQGTIHLVAIQDTVSPMEHRRTEYKFMQKSHVQQWWTSQESIQLHYVYICPVMPAGMERKMKVAEGDDVVAGLKSEMEYFVHVEPMADCVPHMHENEYELLRTLANAREEAVKQRAKAKQESSRQYRDKVRALPEEGRKMHDRTRPELEEVARSRGVVDPRKAMFPTKLDLVVAIIDQSAGELQGEAFELKG